MATINVYAAKTNLSRLIDRAEAGEEIVITRHGRPVARLVPANETAKSPRKLGRLAGRIRVRRDFDAPLPEEILRSFEGGGS
jgi:prevent-host-death family protein